MITAKQVYKLLPPAKNIDTLTIRNQTTNDIVNQVLSQHKLNLKQANKIAHLFDGGNAYNTCQNIWNFLKYQIPYKIEPSSKQTTKSLSRIVYDSFNGNGNDCKHYSGFAGAVLGALKYPFKYRFTGYSDYIKTPTHVYVVCLDDNGSEIYVDAVMNDFDVQKPFKLKIDKNMSLYRLSGFDEAEVGRINLKKVVKKTGQAIKTGAKKAGKAVADAAKVVKQGALTVSLTIPRNAFLLLLKFNVHGWATGLSRMSWDKLKWWKDWAGGNRTELMEVIQQGAKRKRILGISDDEILFDSTYKGIGLEPVSVTSALATATPIIVKVQSLLNEAEKISNSVEKITDTANKTKSAIDKGKQTFESLTGKKVDEIIFKKDAGKTTSKSSLSPSDFKTPTDAEAMQVAQAGAQSSGSGKNIMLISAAAALLLLLLNKKR